jgi:6-phosphogluconate dehydrogenase
LIQAQRDYFGAHGFLRTDSNDKTLQHGPWARKKN